MWLVLAPPVMFQRYFGEPFMANGAIVTLDVSVLLRFAWLDVLHMNAKTSSK